MKATAQEYDFHRRILARDDPVAFAQLAECLYVPLLQDVQQRAAGSHADPALVEEAVGQALLNYHDTPTKYDPERASLHSYLAMVAYRDFQNTLAKELRVRAHHVPLSDCEGAASLEATEPAEIIVSQMQAAEIWQFVQELFRDPIERRIVTLIINGVRAPEPYAQILGIGDMPEEKQIEQIRLVKYRITRRLRRKMIQRLQRTEGDRS